MKKLLSLISALALAVSMAACGAPATAPAAAGTKKDAADCKIGIIQLTEHVALDAAREGFMDTLIAAGYSKDNIDVQNAQGEIPNCATIATKFVNDKVDLIFAIATNAAQAAAQATKDIPILATAVTDFEFAGLVTKNDAPGGNVSGTSDMNPIDEQTKLLQEAVPNVKTVGIVYCSAEDNSKLQADLAKKSFEALGITVNTYTASDSNDIQPVLTKACGEVDAIYLPTDNLFAGNMPAVSLVTEPAKIPVICGESGMVDAGGSFTYGLDYYNLGKMSAEQAIDVLQNGKSVAEMPVGFASEGDLKFSINQANLDAIGLVLPQSLTEKVAK